MKKILLFLILIPSITFGCSLEIIGFKGLNSAFDHQAFYEYVNLKNGCSKIFEWNEVPQAVKYINERRTSYHFYGFSRGAASVASAMKQVKHIPEYIVTVGAWHSVDLDFSLYNIRFSNYFDDSGRQQKSPGVQIINVPHMMMQEHINQFYK